MSALAIEYSGVALARVVSPGIAADSDEIEKLLEERDISLGQAESLNDFNKNYKVKCELNHIYNECFQGNWDGYGAKAITLDTYQEANYILDIFISAFLNFPYPEITPVPNGDIAFEWYDFNGNTFIFSIDNNQTMTYAGEFGPEYKPHGILNYYDSLPQTIIDNLLKLSY